ncbi:MAG: ATP-binding cassette domain-containing protein [Clostridia bacterium]|nr:ATP-binding cassette domain-containing protein [Clostridia bacterium]
MPIRVRNLSKGFDGKPVLSGLSFDLPDRGVVAVEGRSGAGKTTLLNILMGLIPPDEGQIEGLAGKRVTAVFQEDRLLENWSAMKNIRLVCGAPEAEIAAHLRAVGLAGEEKTPVRSLSGGMRRRVALVRAVIAPGDILILDEPFKGLDGATRDAAIRYVLDHAANRLILLVTHDRGEAAQMGAVAAVRVGDEQTDQSNGENTP